MENVSSTLTCAQITSPGTSSVKYNMLMLMLTHNNHFNRVELYTSHFCFVNFAEVKMAVYLSNMLTKKIPKSAQGRMCYVHASDATHWICGLFLCNFTSINFEIVVWYLLNNYGEIRQSDAPSYWQAFILPVKCLTAFAVHVTDSGVVWASHGLHPVINKTDVLITESSKCTHIHMNYL